MKTYFKLGYNGDIGDEIDVKFNDLTKGSHSMVQVKCDSCGDIKETMYNQLVKYNQTENYICRKCNNKKNLLEKYGVINVFQLTEIKEKTKKTNIEKYGVENPSQSEVIKEKKKDTNRKIFGNDWALSSLQVKEKSKKTLMDKYGVDNISKIDVIKQKKKATCFNNFGAEVISQTQRFRDLYKNKILNFLQEKYNIIDYNDNSYTLHCKECGNDYQINKKSFQTRNNFNVDICTICNPINSHTSSLENNLKDYLAELKEKLIFNDRSIIAPYELDIYLPEQKLGIEFNGLYWHSELFKTKDYHLKKTEMAEKNDIKLIHIYEDDWLYKQNIVKSRISNILGKSEKIYARKCEIKEINDNDLVREFLNINHIQGFVGSRIKIGLFYNQELVSLMTFGSIRKPMMGKNSTGTFELLRFCNKLNITVIGGASRLFKYFIRKYTPTKVISYADRSWGQGNMYEKLGFKLIHKTEPNYYYIIGNQRKYRFNYRKDKLIREGFDASKTEHEIMLERDIFRIYDSGNLKYIANF
jgi:hypothetical protein